MKNINECCMYGLGWVGLGDDEIWYSVLRRFLNFDSHIY